MNIFNRNRPWMRGEPAPAAIVAEKKPKKEPKPAAIVAEKKPKKEPKPRKPGK